MKHFLILVLVAVVGVSSSTAQDERINYQANDVTHVNSLHCAATTFDARVADWNAHALPIFEELVAEGEILYAGMSIHAYGDEWNVVWTVTAENMTKLLEVGPEFRRRRAERFPDRVSVGICNKHKDNFYYTAGETAWQPTR